MQFQKGNQVRRGKANPNAGRRPDAARQERKKILQDALPPEKMTAIVRKQAEAAENGDLKAAQWCWMLVHGRPANLFDERLSEARAALVEQQHDNRLVEAQTRELEARTERSRMECSLVQMSYVSEEEERTRMQRLAESVNRPLLHMTPEIAATFGITDPDKLEELKAYLGREQVEIIREVFGEEDSHQTVYTEAGEELE